MLYEVITGQDLLELIVRGLRAHGRGRIERVARLVSRGARYRAIHELAVEARRHERARGAGADLTLVEREHREALERLVREVVVLREHVFEEDVSYNFV